MFIEGNLSQEEQNTKQLNALEASDEDQDPQTDDTKETSDFSERLAFDEESSLQLNYSRNIGDTAGMDKRQICLKTDSVFLNNRQYIKSECNQAWNIHSNLSDIPLDIADSDVKSYRRQKRLSDDILFRSRKIIELNSALYEMAKFPKKRIDTNWDMLLPEVETSLSMLKRGKTLSSLCLAAKYPLIQSFFKKLPAAIHGKILTFLTGLEDLYTSVLWLSMRSELNKYDRAFIQNASIHRAEASFLKRVSMNLYVQLNNRRNKSEMMIEKTVSFKMWQEKFFESTRLKKDNRISQNRSKSLKTEKNEFPRMFAVEKKGPS